MPEVQKMQRKFFQNFVDTSMNGTTASYYRLGKDLEEFNIEMNPDTETGKKEHHRHRRAVRGLRHHHR